ncbi:hypothetical protein H6P81_008899 [Aristolochia fimbriata]|uniref:Transcription termination and cleavage factor C-terminal domain-containing protein n=1 Tax=Aristolochia fimbriata TaxID=158543 RepID=A0AAV7EJP1_ARIFI|nr:hypothetical protein H6P81_008899 [Aristolochia fimbriata]
MLGMVQPPQVMPNIQQTLSQASQQPHVQTGQSTNMPPTPLLGQSVLGGPPTTSQLPYPSRQQSSQSSPFTTTSAPPLTLPSQTGPQHSKGHLGAQISSGTLPQLSHAHNPSAVPHHSASLQSSVLQPPISSQSQQPLQAPGIHHQPLQPLQPPQSRPSSLQPFSHQMHSQMGPASGFQPPQQIMSQPIFHSGVNPQPGVGSSFSQGQPPIRSQPPPQQLYQIGGHGGAEYSSSQGPNAMQVDRGAPWMSGAPESSPGGAILPGPPQLVPAQMTSNVQPPRPPQLTPEMEKAVLQQVMSLTPEQINLLPPEQRQQQESLEQLNKSLKTEIDPSYRAGRRRKKADRSISFQQLREVSVRAKRVWSTDCALLRLYYDQKNRAVNVVEKIKLNIIFGWQRIIEQFEPLRMYCVRPTYALGRVWLGMTFWIRRRGRGLRVRSMERAKLETFELGSPRLRLARFTFRYIQTFELNMTFHERFSSSGSSSRKFPAKAALVERQPSYSRPLHR